MKEKVLESLVLRIEEAIMEGFYIEAVSITYSILENKTYDLLNMLGIPYKGADRTYQCLTYFSMHMEKRDIIICEDANKNCVLMDWLEEIFLTSGLVDGIHAWRNERNVITHDLVRKGMKIPELERLALEGKKLVMEYIEKIEALEEYI